MNLDALRSVPWWGWVIAAVGAGGIVYVFWKSRSGGGNTLGQSGSPSSQLPAEIDPLTGVPYQVEEAINPATGLPAYYNTTGSGSGNTPPPPPPISFPPPTTIQPPPTPGGPPNSNKTPPGVGRFPPGDSHFSVNPGPGTTHLPGVPDRNFSHPPAGTRMAGPGAGGGRVVTAGVWPSPQTSLAALHAQYGGGMPLSQWSQQVQQLNPGINPDALFPRERVVIP